MAFCTNCGTEIKDSAKFCPKCGAAVEEAPQTPKAPSAPQSVPYAAAAAAVAGNAWDKLFPLLRRHYKAIGIAVLALIVLTQLSRCVGGGGKEDKFTDQIQGSWAMQTMIAGDSGVLVSRPNNIIISKNSIQIPRGQKTASCPMSETEYKKDALYFSTQWHESELGRDQDYNLRLVYNKKDDLLTLEFEVSGKWYGLGEYARTN